MTEARFVLDASVALSWCFADEADPVADHLLEVMREGVVLVPSLWFLEVGNALLSAQRRGRLAPSEAEEFLALLARLPILARPLDGKRCWSTVLELARNHGLSAYDAAYLELASRERLPLTTLDARLQAAAERVGLPAPPRPGGP